MRGCQLNDPEVVTDGNVRVQPPAKALVEAFGSVHV